MDIYDTSCYVIDLFIRPQERRLLPSQSIGNTRRMVEEETFIGSRDRGDRDRMGQTMGLNITF